MCIRDRVEGGRFQTIVLLGKKKVPDILTGKLFRVLFHVIKEIRNIVFVAVDVYKRQGYNKSNMS